jgi:integrase
MLKRRLEGISERWAYDIKVTLQKYLDYVEWEINEQKTLTYLEQLRDHYSICSYRKRAYQIRRFLKHFDVSWIDEISLLPEPLKLPKRVTVDDIRKSLDFFNGHEYEVQMKSVVLLGATTGMRAEELFQLQQRDFIFSNNIVRIKNDPNTGRSVKTGEPRIAIFNDEAKKYLVDFFKIFNEKMCYRLSYLFGQSHIEREFRKSPLWVKELRKFFSQEWDRLGGITSIKNILMGNNGDVDFCHYNAAKQGKNVF